MSLSSFFLVTGVALFAVFLFFKPFKVDIANPGEMPQIELNRFIVHEVTEQGVKTILAGGYARRYEDRFTVSDVNVTDKAKSHIQSMQADEGIYKEPVIVLKQHVRYQRDDGVKFQTQEVEYNQSSGEMVASDRFILWQGNDRLEGKALHFNAYDGIASGINIVGNYELKEK